MASPWCAIIDNSFGPYAGRCRGGFDLTLLFEESILIIPITAILLLVAPLRISYLCKSTVKVKHSCWIYAKIILYVLLIGSQIGSLVLWKQRVSVTTKATLSTSAISFVGSLSLLALSCFEHVYSSRPSTLLNLFLLLSTLFEAVRARTLWLQGYNRFNAIAALIVTVLQLIILGLEMVEKRSFLRLEYQSLPSEATSGIFSTWGFVWLLPLFRRGYSKQLEIDDLLELDQHLKSQHLQNKLRAKWDTALSKGHDNALLWAVLKTLWKPILAVVFPRLCFTAFTFCQPFLISATINWSEQNSNTDDMSQGYGLIGAWFLVFVGIAVSMGQYQHFTYRAITMMRGQLISMLYDKATRINITTADPTSALTLMSADIERIDMGWRTAHEVWANLLEIAIAVWLLERQVGVASVIPLGLGIASILGSIVAVSFVMATQARWLEAIEKRIAVTSKMLGGIKGVKMCGLTDVLKRRIQAMREEELHISKNFRKLLIWNMGLAYFAPLVSPVLTFMAFSFIQKAQNNGENINTDRVFTVLSLFALLQEPLTSFVSALSSLVGSIGCFTRIQAFLESNVQVDDRIIDISRVRDGSSSSRDILEKDEALGFENKSNVLVKQTTRGMDVLDSCHAVVVKSGTFGYDPTNKPNLSAIDVEIPAGKFTLLVGPVGSGKSTLLKAILGEVSIMSGSIHLCSSDIAYCDQTPWHMNGTIRDSIIAFSPVNNAWYQQVLEACALEEDLAQLPKRDLTQIGSKGIVLSGGQSQRISLARAVYARKDSVILDDVFSGLDAHTENCVFHNLLGTNGILRKSNTTVIVASSRTKRLPFADHIISLDGTGTGCEQGTFEKLSTSGGYVSQGPLSSVDWTNVTVPKLPAEAKSNADSPANLEVALLKEEEDEANRRTGDMAIYAYYAGAIGWIPIVLFVFAICGYIFCQSFPTIWVNWWAAANVKQPFHRLGYYLGIYAMLSALALLFLVVSCWQMIVTMVPLSGKNFHRALLNTVLDAPMSFFTVTDSGITINRFSQDLQLIDMDLPLSALNTFATLVLCIAQIALVAVGSYYTAIAFPFLFAALWVVQHVYLRTSRQVRFMDLEAKSPLYALFTESVSGLVTLRAFGWREALENKNHELLDQSQRPYYLLYAIQRWLTFVLDMFVAGVAVLLIVLVTQLRGLLPSGLIGVALVNVILFSQNLKLLLTFWTNLETHIGAIARIRSFTSTTASEHESQEKEHPPSTWPSQGTVVFDNVSAGYKKSESILKNVTLSIEAGQKIGICGRTGSGKSSTVACLFRMIDLQSGRITVDGLDIATLPREEVRKRLVGVPQDAFIIEGSSVRLNADPSGEFSDQAIEDALRVVELWEIVMKKGDLDSPIEDLHLTHGQQQLFCIARAMLRPSPVVVLDEATSSIDSRTDELIRKVMHERFSDRTVISVVHKLQSALDDFDMVAVLEAGVLRDFGPPRELLERGAGASAFAALYESVVEKNQDQMTLVEK